MFVLFVFSAQQAAVVRTLTEVCLSNRINMLKSLIHMYHVGNVTILPLRFSVSAAGQNFHCQTKSKSSLLNLTLPSGPVHAYPDIFESASFSF